MRIIYDWLVYRTVIKYTAILANGEGTLLPLRGATREVEGFAQEVSDRAEAIVHWNPVLFPGKSEQGNT